MAFDRGVWMLYRGVEVLCDELMLAWVPPSLYQDLMQQGYARAGHYLPGGSTHENGLFPWERAVITSSSFPHEGRLLLGAVGGGRELPGLLDLGFHVTAFEPNDVLVAGAQHLASTLHGAQVHQGSYADLIRAIHDGDGPLAEALSGPPFDGIILGWGSLTHVIDEQERRELLTALRILAPTAPVLISFFLRSDKPNQGNSERLRHWLRPWLDRAGAPYRPEPGVLVDPRFGFVYAFTEKEIYDLAFSCGYRVELLKPCDFSHALFVPIDPPTT
jgi:hypothetical protein